MNCSAICLAALIAVFAPAQKHPGCLSTQADLDRMKAKVAAGEEPWKGSWDKLVKNTDNFVKNDPGV
ncbi:hypothetical protein N9C66_09980 [Akkermansiaceae bacterium]|nr:hypothetical protein [Akkermansiaceae bacterium]